MKITAVKICEFCKEIYFPRNNVKNPVTCGKPECKKANQRRRKNEAYRHNPVFREKRKAEGRLYYHLNKKAL